MTGSNFPRLALVGALAAGALAAGVEPAAAQTCAARVDAIADNYGLTVTAPKLSPDLRSEDLAESGGVIQPPAVNDPAVIEPPRRGITQMETTPGSADITPPLGAAERAIVESVLMAARAEAASGREGDCYRQLVDALEMLSRPNP